MELLEKEELDGMKVDAYKNLHEECVSIRSRETDTYGKVIGHVQSIPLENAEFVVRESGRQKVLEEEKKNVHAVVRGTVHLEQPVNKNLAKITYNPYKFKHFVTREGHKPVRTAKIAIVNTREVLAKGIDYYPKR